MSTEFPWARFLPPDEIPQMLADVADAAGRGMDELDQTVREWRATAEIHADPELVRRLTGPTGDCGAVLPPDPRRPSRFPRLEPPAMTTSNKPFLTAIAAEQVAPIPATREEATRHAWVRHYAAQALAAYAQFRIAIRTMEPNPRPGSRPDLGYLSLIATASTAAAVALLGPLDAPGLIWDLTPEAGALNGEWEDWLTDVLVRYGINPADIDPDLNPADFAEEIQP